jgi:hypothetical protein
MIPDSVTHIGILAFEGCTTLHSNETAGFSIEESGRSNWRKVEMRFAIVSTIKKLNRCIAKGWTHS